MRLEELLGELLVSFSSFLLLLLSLSLAESSEFSSLPSSSSSAGSQESGSAAGLSHPSAFVLLSTITGRSKQKEGFMLLSEEMQQFSKICFSLLSFCNKTSTGFLVF